jgi:hypothetical protein
MERHTILSQLDPEAAAPLLTRREAIRRGASVSSVVAAGLAMGSVPVTLAALARDVYGQGAPADIVPILNFALLLEQLESQFYTIGLQQAGLLAGDERGAFTQILKHENAHVAYLTQTITSLGGTPGTSPTFDFTGGHGSLDGPFADVLTNPDTFRLVAQTLEDTGVRAYKGQAPRLIGNPTVLTAALRIHSVEARHAAKVRMLRGDPPYIVGDTAPDPQVQATYAGEDNQNQGSIGGFDSPSAEVAQRAFDEPLSADAVMNIVTLFIAG